MLRRYKKAIYDEEREIIYPMRSEIHFNADITDDDGLLANSFCRKYGLSFSEASSTVKSQAVALRENLYQDGEITLGNLGILRVGGERNISFLPFSRKSDLSSRLGFLPISMNNAANLSLGTTETIPYSDNIRDKKKNNCLDFEKNYYIPINKIFAKTAATFILIIIVALSLIFPTSDRMKEDRASVVPVDTLIKEVVRNTTEHGSKTDSIKLQQSVTEKEMPTLNSKGAYKLVVGTFTNEKEASKYIELMKGAGYELIDNPSGKMHRVSAYASDNSSELYAILNSKEFSQTFSQAWIWQDKR